MRQDSHCPLNHPSGKQSDQAICHLINIKIAIFSAPLCASPFLCLASARVTTGYTSSASIFRLPAWQQSNRQYVPPLLWANKVTLFLNSWIHPVTQVMPSCKVRTACKRNFVSHLNCLSLITHFQQANNEKNTRNRWGWIFRVAPM